jgi:glycosyltransferase involved in cell wall biosynthesis
MPRLDDYGAEHEHNHTLHLDLRLALAPFTGALLDLWPMRRAALRGARRVAVHSEALAEAIAADRGAADVSLIRPGVADPGEHEILRRSQAADEIRRRFDLQDAIVFGVFGPVTSSRHVGETLHALASARTSHPDIRLLVTGVAGDRGELESILRDHGLGHAVILSGPVPDRELPSWLGAVDVAVSIAWPDLADTHRTWLRCLACGLPTIVLDRAAHQGVPVLDLREPERSSAAGHPPAPPVAVAIDPRVRPRELQTAMVRLASDPSLRRHMGEAARQWWSSNRSARTMAGDYLEAIDRAARAAVPDVSLPHHLRPDVFEHARRLLREVGAVLPEGIRASPAAHRDE